MNQRPEIQWRLVALQVTLSFVAVAVGWALAAAGR